MRRPSILVADEAWVALARLHREHPDRTAFTSSEIVQTIKAEHAHPDFRAGIYPHINTHNVANLPPNSARYRMFYRLPNATYRLFHQGDDYHSHRTGKTHPQRRQLPEVYHHLLDWYEREYSSAANAGASLADPLLSLSGVGREIWTRVDADEYVNRLREAWFKDEEARVPSRSGPDIEEIWARIKKHEGEEFTTIKGLPFTFQVEGESGLWFYRNRKRIERRLWKGEVEQAIERLPLRGPSDLRDLQDPSYLFGLLNDPRVLGD